MRENYLFGQIQGFLGGKVTTVTYAELITWSEGGCEVLIKSSH